MGWVGGIAGNPATRERAEEASSSSRLVHGWSWWRAAQQTDPRLTRQRHCPLPRPPLSERPADRLSVNAGKANSRCVEQRRHLPESLPWGPARCHNEASPPPPGEPHTCGCNAMTEISGFITMLVASSIHMYASSVELRNRCKPRKHGKQQNIKHMDQLIQEMAVVC